VSKCEPPAVGGRLLGAELGGGGGGGGAARGVGGGGGVRRVGGGSLGVAVTSCAFGSKTMCETGQSHFRFQD
jgi:hypothetical protein